MLNAVLVGAQSPTYENIIQTIRQWIFSSRLTDNGKMLYFPLYFGDLDRVEKRSFGGGNKFLESLAGIK